MRDKYISELNKLEDQDDEIIENSKTQNKKHKSKNNKSKLNIEESGIFGKLYNYVSSYFW